MRFLGFRQSFADDRFQLSDPGPSHGLLTSLQMCRAQIIEVTREELRNRFRVKLPRFNRLGCERTWHHPVLHESR